MTTAFTTTRIVYGTVSSSQYVLLHVPLRNTSSNVPKFPTLFFIHGGFWKASYGIDPPTACCDTIVDSVISRQIACAFVEYRRDGDEAWGWPATNIDIIAAYEALLSSPLVDGEAVAIVGHSAGGTLALWLTSQLVNNFRSAKRHTPPFDGVDIHTLPAPRVTIGLAPVSDLSLAAKLRLSDEGNAVQRYMHIDDENVAAHFFKPACPTAHAHILTLSRVTLMLGDHDDVIPTQVVQSTFDTLKTSRALLPDDIQSTLPALRFVLLRDCDHYDIVNARSAAWKIVLEEILRGLHQNNPTNHIDPTLSSS